MNSIKFDLNKVNIDHGRLHFTDPKFKNDKGINIHNPLPSIFRRTIKVKIGKETIRLNEKSSENFVERFSKDIKCEKSKKEKRRQIKLELQRIYSESGVVKTEKFLHEKSREVNPLLGKKIPYEVACQKMDLLGDDFEMDELILVSRQDGSYQYVLFKGIVSEDKALFAVKEGQNLEKPLSAFNKIQHLDGNSLDEKRPILDEPIQIAFESEVRLKSDYKRTEQMKYNLNQFPNYHRDTNTLEINDKYYVAISGKTKDFINQPIACCGSNLAREVLILDPKESKELNKHFDELLKILSKKAELPEEVVLETVIKYVREKVFPSHSDPKLVLKLFEMINEIKNDDQSDRVDVLGSKVPFIPIDAFVIRGIGVCRHHALVTAYFLNRLSESQSGNKKSLLSGTVQFMRDDVPGGAHAWVTFVNQKRKMHIDTLWNVTNDFSTELGRKELEVIYGAESIARQIEKTSL